MLGMCLTEYALLANDVYLSELEPPDPTMVAYGLHRIELDHRKFSSGFFARLYYSELAAGYVLAFRGTQLSDWGSVSADLEYGAGARPALYSCAMDVFHAVLRHTPKALGHIAFAGHSLGGILAKLLAVDTGITSVAFNSPGVKRFLGHHSARDIVNVNAYKDVVSKIGDQVGTIINVKVREGDLLCATDDVLLFNKLACGVDKHSMQHLVNALLFDSQQGERSF